MKQAMPLVSRPRVLIAEDYTLLREGMRQLVGEKLEVVGAVGDGRALLLAALRSQPDVILLGISMPFITGLDAARQLAWVCPRSRIIFVTDHTALRHVQAAFEAGGHGYVTKHDTSAEVMAAVRAVLAGQSYVSPSLLLNIAWPSLTGHGEFFRDGGLRSRIRH